MGSERKWKAYEDGNNDWYEYLDSSEGESSDAAPVDERIATELADAYATEIQNRDDKEDGLIPPEEDELVHENEDDPDAPIALNTLREQLDEVSVERIGTAAREETDFTVVVAEMDRLDRNRMRRERYHENLRGDVPLEVGATDGGRVFPRSLNTGVQTLIRSGRFLDLYYDCPYEMHQLTTDRAISQMVEDLKEEHKEVLYYLSLRLYKTVQLAEIRGQSDRNIRKIRDTYTRKLQRQLYDYLCEKRNLTLREKEFLSSFEASMEMNGRISARVRRENKYPRRKKAAPVIDDNRDG